MSSSYELPTFSLTEVDDIMEVSSEHGHNVGDEDIDIDIDLTAGQVDEDYVLEDATSNAALDDDFNLQPSPAAVNDDPMIDEEEGIYQEHREDFIHHEENDTMDHETLHMSFEPTEPTEPVNVAGSDQTLIPTGTGDLQDRSAETVSELLEEQAGTESIGPPGDLEDVEVEDALDSREETQNRSADFATEDLPQKLSRSSTPRGAKTNDNLNSPPASALESLVNALVHPDSDVNSTNISAESEGLSDQPEADLSNLLSRQVAVVYQNVDYILFSTSESEDPNSFFLSDLSIAEKPLTNFFEAIRNVIREDLGDEDELYIVVEDLGLEIAENNGACQDVTFAQIINLHNKLLENDGVDSPVSLHLHLGCRPNFALRFANLAKSAEEGKGLSEVVQSVEWDEHSDSPDQLQNLEDHQDDDGSHVQEAEENDNAFDEENIDPSLDQSLAQDLVETVPSGTNNGLGSTSNPETTHLTSSVDASTLDAGQAVAGDTDIRNSNGEYDEDGDLLDYSDEEIEVPARPSKEAASGSPRLETDNGRDYNGTIDDFISPCLKPLTCFCSKCMEEFSANERAKEEAYRRRSKSRQAEENARDDTDHNALEQQTDIAETVSKDFDGQGVLLDVEDGVDYEDDDHGEGYVDSEPKAQLTNDEHYEDEGLAQLHGNEVLHDETENGQEEFGVNGSASGFQHGVQTHEYDLHVENSGESFEDEIGFDEDDFTKPEEFQESSDLGHVASLGVSAGDSEKESVHGPSSTLGSESDKTLEKQAGSDILDEDEINYDDDDEEQETLQVQPVASEVKVSPPPTASGKRPRADEHSDEGMRTRNKDAKRLRP